jgi:hypothetical protein
LSITYSTLIVLALVAAYNSNSLLSGNNNLMML